MFFYCVLGFPLTAEYKVFKYLNLQKITDDMVIIDQYRITDDGNHLLLQAHVSKAVGADNTPLFENVHIKRVVIKTAGMVSEVAPEMWGNDYIYEKVFSEPQDEICILLTPTALQEKFPKNTFTQDLFFAFIETEGEPNPCVPCGCDETVTEAVTFDETLLYQKVMGFTKELLKCCNTSTKGFVDFILLWNAFKAAVETEHWNAAIKFYKMLFSEISSINYTKACGCHG